MEKSNWIPLAALIAAIIIPFSNSLFQDWLRKRSERIASANPALNQPKASTQRGARWRWLIVFVQILAGMVSISFIQSLWRPVNWRSWLLTALSGTLLVSVQALPWAIRRLTTVPLPEPKMLLQFSLLWDKVQNPYCPVDEAPLFVNRTVEAAANKHGRHDILKCPKCKQEFPIRTDYMGLITLTHAKQSIEGDLRTGRISD